MTANWSRTYKSHMSPTIHQQIDSRVQSFVSELSSLVRAVALQSVQALLGDQPQAVRRGPGRPHAIVAKGKVQACGTLCELREPPTPGAALAFQR